MNTLLKTATVLALAAFSAPALDKDFVSQLMDSAKNIERDATAVGMALKQKNVDAAGVKSKIDAMGSDLDKLQEAVNKFESSKPSMSARDQQDWNLVKQKVQLLEIFHAQKKKLAGEDLYRNRTLIRAHATGVAKRAQNLQKSLTTLERSPQS
jgi:hypothetical protein